MSFLRIIHALKIALSWYRCIQDQKGSFFDKNYSIYSGDDEKFDTTLVRERNATHVSWS